ncbi:MAG: RNB domain-containing ribonuclease [Myxococcales bacterium]|nr:RNB domain-containing ribonuclease [Myxococcales bacterium]MCB9731682.1 RNB domain-containing ribonuclease [Deltaproteobacteria bacterium]
MSETLIVEHTGPDDAGRPNARPLFGGGAPFALRGPVDAEPGAILRVGAGDHAVTAVLAAAGTARAAIYRILERFGVDPDHPPAARAEADALVAAPGLDDPALDDLRALPFVTIDGADSRDLDQALHVEGAEDGAAWVVRYALADASYYVRPGSVLFDEALARGASYYLPGLVAPMLPRALSEGIVSLNPDVERRALVLTMTVDRASGDCTATAIGRARVRSHAKLSYDGVEAYYDAADRAAHPLAGKPWTAVLDGLEAVGRRRIARAEQKDIVCYNRVNVSVGLSPPAGTRFVAVDDPRNKTERYNEQISLLCNIEGAKLLASAHGNGVRAIFRVHRPPSEPELGHLEEVIADIVAAHGLPPKVWRWRRRPNKKGPGESLADYLDRLPQGGDTEPVYAAINRQALMTNARSTFQAEPGLHYGVGAPVYARFSSPMREVVGIFTHKEALDLLRGDEEPGDEALQPRIIDAANRAKELQRQLTKEANLLVIDELFAADLAAPIADRPARDGLVLGLSDDRLYVQLDDPPLEVKVYLKDVAQAIGATLRVEDHARASLVGPGGAERALRVGDRIRLRVEGRDDARRRWLLVPR